MEFIWAIIQVVLGAFVLFFLAKAAYLFFGVTNPWSWITLVGGLALANMLIHRFLGGTISPPFYTAVLFGITLYGLDQQVEIAPKVTKRALYALAMSTVLGWLTFAELHQLPQ